MESRTRSYNMFKYDRKGKIGGSVAFWVKDDSCIEEGALNDFEKRTNVVSVWVEIRDCRNSKILVGCI